MVYCKDSLEVLHELTAAGRVNYQNMLEKEADEILWKDAHKLKAFFLKLFSWIPGLDEWLHSI